MAAALSMSENVSTPAPRAPPSVLSSPSTSHMLSITYLRPAFFSTHSLILVCSTKHCSPLDRVWILLFVSASVFLLAGWPCTGWANSPRNKFARVENRGTRRKMPRKKGLTHLNISGSWKLGLSSGVRCTKVSVCFWPPAESPTQGSVPGQSCCNHIFPTLTSSYIAGFGAHAVALCPLKASPRLSQGRGTPRSSCRCPELLLSLFTHSALSCLKDFPDFMRLNHFEKHYLPSLQQSGNAFERQTMSWLCSLQSLNQEGHGRQSFKEYKSNVSKRPQFNLCQTPLNNWKSHMLLSHLIDTMELLFCPRVFQHTPN